MLHNTIADNPPLHEVRAEDLRAYLAASGWQVGLSQPDSRDYCVWEHPAMLGDGPPVLAPAEDGQPHHTVRVAQALQVLALVEGRAMMEIFVNIAAMSDNPGLTEVAAAVLSEIGASLGRCHRMMHPEQETPQLNGWPGLTRERVKGQLPDLQGEHVVYVSDDAIDGFVCSHPLPEDAGLLLDAILGEAARWYAAGVISEATGMARADFDAAATT